MTVLAVDGGNTKTDVLVLTTDGEVLGHTKVGRTDIYGDESGSVQRMRAGLDDAFAAAGIGPESLAAAAFRLAGRDFQVDEDFWRERLTSWGINCPTTILNDGCAGIRTGNLDGIGMAITGGTSSAMGARGPGGRIWSLDMWAQEPMGAWGLGLEGYRAAVLAHLGLAEPTALQEVLPEFYGVDSVPALNELAVGRATVFDGLRYAAAAPVVAAAAADGDPVAVEISHEQARRFFAYTSVAVRETELDPAGSWSIAIGGSVLRAPGSVVAEHLRSLVAQAFPATVVRVSDLPPVAGAALDAIAEAGVAPTAEHRLRIAEFLAAH